MASRHGRAWPIVVGIDRPAEPCLDTEARVAVAATPTAPAGFVCGLDAAHLPQLRLAERHLDSAAGRGIGLSPTPHTRPHGIAMQSPSIIEIVSEEVDGTASLLRGPKSLVFSRLLARWCPWTVLILSNLRQFNTL